MRKTMTVPALAFLLIVTSSACGNPPAQSTTVPAITGAHIPVPVLTGSLPTNASEAPDDIVVTPGGNAYRANVHQQGVPDKWPSIETVETRLVNGSDAIFVRYRSNITTKAGEVRNSLLYVRKEDGSFEREDIKLYTVGAPTDMQFLQDQAFGLLGTLAALLVIEIPQNVKPGQYDFNIGVEIEGNDYGTLLCTIEVTK